MKKFLSMLLAIAMVLSFGVAAFADYGSEIPVDPGENVPVVNPAVITEEVANTVPETAKTAEEAVEMVSMDTPVVAVAGEVSYTDTNNEVVTVIGFNVVDGKNNDTVEIVKDAEVVDVIKTEDLIMTPIAEADQVLTPEQSKQLTDDINATNAIESANGNTLLSAWWFNANEETAGEVAVKINEHKEDVTDEMNYGVKFTFACIGTTPHVYLNGRLLPLVENGDGTYTVILSEEGSVAIYGNVTGVVTDTTVTLNK